MKKQNIGEPCNGCGTCCNAQVCMNGAYVIGLVKNLGDTVSGACPAIVRSPNGNIRCGILLNPNKYIKKSKYPAKILSKYFGHLIGAGAGCDELYENDTPEEINKLQKILDEKMNDRQWRKKTETALRIIHGIG